MKDQYQYYYKFLINFYNVLNKKLTRIERETEERKRDNEKEGGWREENM